MGRRARPEQLPELGAWDGPIYGELGVLAAQDDRVQCHACAGWYKLLAAHAWLAHGLTAAAYRAVFGLRRRTALAGVTLRDRRRELSGERMRAYQKLSAHIVRDMTPEEHSRLRRGIPLPLETRRDPANRERWRRNSERAQVRRRELFQDPEYRARVGRRISEGKGGRVEVDCAVCGTPFEVKRSAAKDYQSHLCGSPECVAEFRRRWAAGLSRLPRHRTVEGTCETCGAAFRGRRGQRFCSLRCGDRASSHKVPGVCRTCGAAFMGEKGQQFCSLSCSARFLRPDARSRASAAARRRGRPHADELAALDPAALAPLPPLAARLVRRYYGLEDGRPWTLRELARAEHVDQTRMSRLIADGVAELLSGDRPRDGAGEGTAGG